MTAKAQTANNSIHWLESIFGKRIISRRRNFKIKKKIRSLWPPYLPCLNVCDFSWGILKDKVERQV
jgi:hypothetical protein